MKPVVLDRMWHYQRCTWGMRNQDPLVRERQGRREGGERRGGKKGRDTETDWFLLQFLWGQVRWCSMPCVWCTIHPLRSDSCNYDLYLLICSEPLRKVIQLHLIKESLQSSAGSRLQGLLQWSCCCQWFLLFAHCWVWALGLKLLLVITVNVSVLVRVLQRNSTELIE